ncbi:MAG TPA: GDSL-type esterase/lipase family protein [Thermoanaerobaculia bacterium]|nr:GDSL-type esterase/lipase family protein [Thermoanaerobaculia bacterium]
MRRTLYWFLPLAAALTAALAFGAGFYSFLRGDRGEPVDFVAPAAETAAAAPERRVSAIILGDSLARGTGDPAGLGIGGRLDEELRRRNVPAAETVNIAVNGARTEQLLRQLESANVRRLIGEANVVIVSIGGNDLWGGTNWREEAPPDPEAVMDEVLDEVERAVESVREANGGARIFLIGLYNPFRETPFGAELSPMVSRWNARVIERFSGDANLTVVQTADLFSHRDRLSLDRFHPGGEGYELIARRIADAL